MEEAIIELEVERLGRRRESELIVSNDIKMALVLSGSQSMRVEAVGEEHTGEARLLKDITTPPVCVLPTCPHSYQVSR